MHRKSISNNNINDSINNNINDNTDFVLSIDEPEHNNTVTSNIWNKSI